MFSLVNLLIIFFFSLILYQIVLANCVTEGMENNTENEYKNYDPNNISILAQQNAGNIEYLKERMNSVQNIAQKVEDLSGNLTNLQKQVEDLVLAQEDYANQLTGGTAPEITGIDDENNEYSATTFIVEDENYT